MKFSLITFFTATAVTDAIPRRLNSGRILYPEDVGALHTEVFETLASMYAIKKPKSRAEMMKDSGNIVVTYCDKGDSACDAYVYKTTEEQFHISDNGSRTISYPEDFDSKLKESMDQVKSIVSSVKNVNIDDVVGELATIKRKVDDMADVKEGYKLAVLSGISVASESSKLWHNVYNDSSHSLHRIHSPSFYSRGNEGDRRLEEEGDTEYYDDTDYYYGVDILGIVFADVSAAVVAGIGAVSESPDVVSIAIAAVTAAIPASLSVLTEDEEGGYDDGEYESEDEEYKNNEEKNEEEMSDGN